MAKGGNKARFYVLNRLKTATTTFQRVIFPSHPQIQYLGDGGALYDQVAHYEDSKFDPKYLQKEFLSQIKNARAEQKLVISNERFSNFPRLSYQISTRLRRIFSGIGYECKLIFVLRRQQDFITSYYLQWVKSLAPHRKPFLNFQDWLDWHYGLQFGTEKEILERNSIWFRLNYYKQSMTFSEVFGKENVKIILFEDFVKAPSEFLRDLFFYMKLEDSIKAHSLGNIKKNTRISQNEYALRQMVGLFPFPVARFFWLLAGNPISILIRKRIFPSGSEKKISLPIKWDDRIRNDFAESNKLLSESFALPLMKDRGYYSG